MAESVENRTSMTGGRRSRPNERPLAERHAEVVAAACRSIEAAVEPPDLDALAQAAGMSRFHFHRVFKKVTGVTPRAYVAGHRGGRVREALRTSRTVTDAIYDAGFNSSGRFYAASSELLGMAPSAFRRGGGGETIRFAVGECSLGSILVAATEKGICTILLGDEPGSLVRELRTASRRRTWPGESRSSSRWWRGSSAWSKRRPSATTCRSTSVGRRSSSGSGRRSGSFRRARPPATAGSPPRSDRQRLPGQSRAHAPPTRSPWRFPVTGWFAATARAAATAGEWSGSRPS